MADYSWPLQQSVYARITGASPAVAGGRCFDHVPDDAVFPYNRIDGAQAMPDTGTKNGANGDDGTVSYIDIHSFSRYRGGKELLDISSRLHDLFDGQALTVTGRSSALCFIDSTRGPLREADGLTRHLITTLKIIHRS
ncbi:DUF3168 domain-containing protein [Pleomorphomonas oryzae]|uniref:DUF3168 domain-containing protein n=1 Tax=Pleomorphomonas oryzae TaxID=261934 RepID=UPI0003FFFD30|nr:DUF3168 domain-containing protein [Pleomorphomonas oryzae]